VCPPAPGAPDQLAPGPFASAFCVLRTAHADVAPLRGVGTRLVRAPAIQGRTYEAGGCSKAAGGWPDGQPATACAPPVVVSATLARRACMGQDHVAPLVLLVPGWQVARDKGWCRPGVARPAGPDGTRATALLLARRRNCHVSPKKPTGPARARRAGPRPAPRPAAVCLPAPIRIMSQSLQNTIAMWLSAHSCGVVLLHVGVYLRYRRNFRWHLFFVLRNLMPWRACKPPPGDSSPQS
jgi:hypothetical protein